MTTHNKGYCFWCGDKTDDYVLTDSGDVRFYVCQKRECQKEAERARKDE